jgi:hypothetical protein
MTSSWCATRPIVAGLPCPCPQPRGRRSSLPSSYRPTAPRAQRTGAVPLFEPPSRLHVPGARTDADVDDRASGQRGTPAISRCYLTVIWLLVPCGLTGRPADPMPFRLFSHQFQKGHGQPQPCCHRGGGGWRRRVRHGSGSSQRYTELWWESRPNHSSLSHQNSVYLAWAAATTRI